MIYFIRQGKTNLVKIGYTEDQNTLDNRVKVLQTGNPYELMEAHERLIKTRY